MCLGITPRMANEANYRVSNKYSVTQSTTLSSTQNYLTDVGLFSNSASYYGTYDQSGDVYEWNDAVISSQLRGLRGGSWNDPSSGLRSTFQGSGSPSGGINEVGFRLASVPEPSVAVSLIIAGVLLLSRRKRSSAL